MPDPSALAGNHQLPAPFQPRQYVDAFFDNVKWEQVDRRLERVEKVAADPRG